METSNAFMTPATSPYSHVPQYDTHYQQHQLTPDHSGYQPYPDFHQNYPTKLPEYPQHYKQPQYSPQHNNQQEYSTVYKQPEYAQPIKQQDYSPQHAMLPSTEFHNLELFSQKSPTNSNSSSSPQFDPLGHSAALERGLHSPAVGSSVFSSQSSRSWSSPTEQEQELVLPGDRDLELLQLLAQLQVRWPSQQHEMPKSTAGGYENHQFAKSTQSAYENHQFGAPFPPTADIR